MPKIINTIKNWKNRTLSLEEFKKIKNKIIVIRRTGGLGDILMHRMMFEDFKLLNPKIHITFALQKKYHDAVKDHPFIDEVIDCDSIEFNNYIIHYVTDSACVRYETRIAPKSDKNRSDIWANHCGLTLKNHDMHIVLSEEERQNGLKIIKKYKKDNNKLIILSPISSNISKNLTEKQQQIIINFLKNRNCSVLGLHTNPIPNLETICGLNIREWLSVINAADFIVSVDTSTFHAAGGLKKPLLGIFAYTCGKTYGKYYNFTLIQKHRDNGDWNCGPCYLYGECPISKEKIKPCLTEINSKMLEEGLEKMLNSY